MHAVGVADYADYIDFLEVHPEEFGRLFDTILINVTAFFRDPPAWEVVGDPGRPAAPGGKRPGEPIRALERRLRLGRGGVHPGDGPGRGPGARRSSATG